MGTAGGDVIEGTGFKSSIIRALVTNILMLTMQRESA